MALETSIRAAVVAYVPRSRRWSFFECLPIQHSCFEQLHRGRAGTPGSPPTSLPAYNVCSAMASPEHTVPRRSRLKDDARNFWHRVSEGLALNQLWSQFEKDARSSYRLYS